MAILADKSVSRLAYSLLCAGAMLAGNSALASDFASWYPYDINGNPRTPGGIGITLPPAASAASTPTLDRLRLPPCPPPTLLERKSQAAMNLRQAVKPNRTCRPNGQASVSFPAAN